MAAKVVLAKLLDPISITVSGAALPVGSTDKDILQWNAGTSGWEAVHAEDAFIKNVATTPGEYKVTNIRLNSDLSILITYDDTPVA
jgi:hypothetical protein